MAESLYEMQLHGEYINYQQLSEIIKCILYNVKPERQKNCFPCRLRAGCCFIKS